MPKPRPIRDVSRTFVIKDRRKSYQWTGDRFAHFTPLYHSQKFGWKRRGFFESLTPHSRVLEVGASDGRLAQYVMSRSSVKPKNYVLMDFAYGGTCEVPRYPRISKKEYDSYRRVAGNLFFPPFRGEKIFDKIIVPESFFSEVSSSNQGTQRYIMKNLTPSERKIARGQFPTDAVFLHILLKKYLPLLRKGGELYVSNIHFTPDWHSPLNQMFLEYLTKASAQKIIEYHFSKGSLVVRRLAA